MKAQQLKKVFAICGSTRKNSSNLQIIKAIERLSEGSLEFDIYTELGTLPHFNPDVDDENLQDTVMAFRKKISEADGVLICTPEYVFSLPGSLKNAIEWTVSTTIFSNKPVAIITASGRGEKAHESLQLIMRTIEARMNDSTQLLIQGARAKLNDSGEITDETVLKKIKELIAGFTMIMGKELNEPA